MTKDDEMADQARILIPGGDVGGLTFAPALRRGGLVVVAIFGLTHEALHERALWPLFGLLAAFCLWGRPTRWSWGGST
jgi:hypothetical protein